MKYKFTLLLVLLLGFNSFAQVVINELDSDSPGVDNLEFVELKSNIPKMSLDGFVLVFFNGSTSGGNTSYFTIDLDGYTTDVNGLLLIGSSDVSPVPQFRISSNTIQNGADALAIYRADSIDFPDRTLATQDNLIDALAYGTNDPVATTLLSLLGISQQINEGANGKKNTESIQRKNDGSYFVGKPTPRQNNDGSGILLNGVDLSFDKSQYNEGDKITIVISTQEAVSNDFTVNFMLNNGTFIQDDFMGNTDVTIPAGQKSVTTEIILIDDIEDEGDEELIFNLSPLPDEYMELKDEVLIRVVDNDYQIADWGTPLQPTRGLVNPTHSLDYYKSLDGKADDELRQTLQNIIADPQIVRAQTYTDIIDVLLKADQNPKNSNQVWLVYSEEGRAKLDYQRTSNNTGKWNREHTFPRSRAGYFSIKEDEEADGKDIYWRTNADSTRHGNSDAHALRAADGGENSSRGNQHYGQYNGPSDTKGSFKGDVARSVLYLALRYNGLEIVNGFPGDKGQLGDLKTLLEWHRNDPPDDYEMNRNNVIQTWQFNRNPFIDQPDLVEHIWGSQQGAIWDKMIANDDLYEMPVKVYPNPSQGSIYVEGIVGETKIEILNIEGKFIKNIILFEDDTIQLSKGEYILKIANKNSYVNRKIIVE